MFSRGLYSVPQYLSTCETEHKKKPRYNLQPVGKTWNLRTLCSSKQTHLFLLSLVQSVKNVKGNKIINDKTSVKWYKFAYPSPCVVGNCDCIFQSRNHNEVSWGVKLYYPTNERTKDYYPRNPYLLFTNLTYTDPLQNWSRQIYVGGSLVICQVPQRHELQYHTADDHLCWRVHNIK